MKFSNLLFVGLIAGGAAFLLSPRFVGGKERDAGRGEELKNVEVMDPTMRMVDARKFMLTFNEALNVQCRDCHDLRDFASDVKEMKLEARRMMKMQQEINAKWFGGKEVVTCWTCHRGMTTPVNSLTNSPTLDPGTKPNAAGE